ncbi:MAG: YdhR family protein [Lachnospiraceae bacterium]|nr:YdhR family protein [Lachnospiraceae bacterium]
MNGLKNLKWKIWAMNTEDPSHLEGCGFYLYPTREAAEARAEEGKATIPNFIGCSNVTTTIWEVLDDYSIATHAPIDVPLISELEEA